MISRFAEKLLPLPGVPKIKPLGFLSFFLSASIMLLVRDYEYVKAVLGKEEVSGIVRMEKQREQLLKEQKRAERRKQNREAR